MTQDRLEMDYQGGEEPSLSVMKTVLDMEQEENTKYKKNDFREEKNMTRDWYQNTLFKIF